MLTAADVIGWLEPVGIPALSADMQGEQPGEQIIVALNSPGSFTGGEGQMRAANFTLTVKAASEARMVEIATQIEAIVPADFAGRGTWPAADAGTVVKFVDYTGGGNSWQRRPIDTADRHCADAQFTATCALIP